MDSQIDISKEGAQKGTVIRVLIADDHALLRESLKELLEKQADLKVVAEAGDGLEAVNLTDQFNPDVVIMDIGMPRMDGLEATRQIKAKHPNVAVLALTVYDDSQHILSILQAGASGYLTKSVFSDTVIRAIHGAASGETILSDTVSQQVIRLAIRHITKPIPLGIVDKINPRELQILKFAATGMSNKDIAGNLGLTLQTTKVYMSELFSKLNVNNRTEAVITALRAGILTLDDLK